MSGKRIQTVEITGENIERLFTGDLVVVEGLPDDAELVRTWEEPARQTFCFMFESEKFPVVEEGKPAPEVDIAVARRRVNNSDYWVCPNCFETMENGDVKCE